MTAKNVPLSQRPSRLSFVVALRRPAHGAFRRLPDLAGPASLKMAR